MTDQPPEDVAPERVRVAILMRREDYDDIKRQADSEGRTMTGHIRRALGLYRWWRQAQIEGRKLYVGDVNGSLNEVTFL